MDKKTKLKSFTLIELVMIIAIITIMASVAVVSLIPSRDYEKLKAAQAETASAIKMAQSYALQGKTQSGEKICGYGLKFNNDKNYEIFYVKFDSDNLSGYNDCGEQNIDPSYRSFSSAGVGNVGVVGSAYSLPGEVRLSSPISDAAIFFDLPHANVYDKNGGLLNTSVIFEFEYPAGSGNKKTITVNERASITEN